MFRFADPWFLILLLIIPAAFYYRRRNKMNPAMAVSQAVWPDAAGSLGSFFVRTRRLWPLSAYLVVMLLVVALARPQWGTRKIETITEGINIILAVDVSGSMRALDFKRDGQIVDRLEAVKGVVEKFIGQRDGDRIGLVVFGTNAFTQVPLTRDYNTIFFILERLMIGAAGEQTAIGDAIGISLKRLVDIESKSNIIILLTDGESNAGELSPDEAATIAREKGVKIYTIGVGSKGEAPFLVDSPLFGKRYVYQQVSIDEDALTRIAEETGGLYFRADNTEALEKIYNRIDKMEKTEAKLEIYANYKDLYGYLAVFALLLIVLRVVAENTRYLEAP